MWQLTQPDKVKLIVAILAADKESLKLAEDAIETRIGRIEMQSESWPFDFTSYYKHEAGENIIRKLVAIESLICPGTLADLKLKTNEMEKQLASQLDSVMPRPVNLDPGYIEPSKLVLASAKNFAHRIYIGRQIWAEVTLIHEKGKWISMRYTFPDYKSGRYDEFLNAVRLRLKDQLNEG